VGKNTDIKHYDFSPTDGQAELFATSASRTAVAGRLREARWFVKAADLMEAAAVSRTDDGALGKRYDEPVDVRWDKAAGRPASFVWRRRRLVVDELMAAWVIESYWWDVVRRVSRSYWRVRAGSAVFDLYLDRVDGRWFLGAAVD